MTIQGLHRVLKRGVALALTAGLMIPVAGNAIAASQPTTDSTFGQEMSSAIPTESTSTTTAIGQDPLSSAVDSENVQQESRADGGSPVQQNSVDVEDPSEVDVDESLTEIASQDIAGLEGSASTNSSAASTTDVAALGTSNESPSVNKVLVAPRLPKEKTAGVYLSNQWTSTVSNGFNFGRATDSFLVGDWNGDGTATLAIRAGNWLYVTNRHGDGAVVSAFTYGKSTDEVLVGDWDGDGKDSMAFRRGEIIYITNEVSGSATATSYKFGNASDTVLVGDWDGDGKDTFANRHGFTYSIYNSLRGGSADTQFNYGRVDDDVLVGDWNGDGKDTLAVRRGNVYHVRNSLGSGNADKTNTFGDASNEIIVGDWNGDGTDTLGKIGRDGVTPAAQKANNPKGNLEALTANADGTITVRGWSFDPDFNGSLNVQLHVDQEPQLILGSIQRPDVKKAFSLSFDTTGFIKTIKVTSGTHEVCATLLNEGAGSNNFLGCLTVKAKVVADSKPTGDPALASASERNAGNVGIPSGVTLKKTTGNMYITKAGTVIDGVDLYGRVIVQAPNVIIQNSFIRGDGTTNKTPVVLNQSTNLLIRDSEIAARTPHPDVLGVIGSNFTLERVNIHDVLDAVHIFGEGNVVVKDSWLHGNLHFESLPELNGGPSHDDSIQIISGSNIVIVGNRMEGAYGAAIQFTQDRGGVFNVRVENNFIGGGGCSLNFAEKDRGPFQAITVKNNLFNRDQRLNGCAVIRPITSEVELLANTWVDGSVVNATRG